MSSLIGTILDVFLISLSLILMIALVVQGRASGGGLLGQADTSFRARKGLEKILFNSTIMLAVLVAALSLVRFVFS